jgi:hypothetical protein
MEKLMFSTRIKHTAKAAVIGFGLLGAAQAHSASLDFGLTSLAGLVNPNYFVGATGLYVGPGPTITSKDWRGNYNFKKSKYNWTFTDVKLSINDDMGSNRGNASVMGTMTNNKYGSSWNINLTLNDLVKRTGSGTGMMLSNTDNLHDIITNGKGVAWQDLSLTYSKLGSSKSTTLEGWQMDHDGEAELFTRGAWGSEDLNGALVFDAWYKKTKTGEYQQCSGWYSNRSCTTKSWEKVVKAGDTKALATYMPPSEVPVPAAAFLFAPALLGFLGLRRKAKQA